MPSANAQTVILATGGTIAGTADNAASHTAYRSGQLGVEALVSAVSALAAWPLRAVQLAQADSKDMSHALWQQLVRVVAAELDREDVSGLVITHGTDTLEETAYFLQRVLAPTKPVVMTAAMRPVTALHDVRSDSSTSRFSSPGTAKIRSTPSFSRALTNRSEAFIRCLQSGGLQARHAVCRAASG